MHSGQQGMGAKFTLPGLAPKIPMRLSILLLPTPHTHPHDLLAGWCQGGSISSKQLVPKLLFGGPIQDCCLINTIDVGLGVRKSSTFLCYSTGI